MVLDVPCPHMYRLQRWARPQPKLMLVLEGDAVVVGVVVVVQGAIAASAPVRAFVSDFTQPPYDPTSFWAVRVWHPSRPHGRLWCSTHPIHTTPRPASAGHTSPCTAPQPFPLSSTGAQL